MNSTFLLGAAEEGFAWGDFLFYLVLFIILMALIKKFAWGPVTEMMEKRATKIATDIDAAEESRKKAEDLAQKREEALQASRTEASEIVNRAKQNGEQQKATIVSAAHYHHAATCLTVHPLHRFLPDFRGVRHQSMPVNQ